MDTIKFRKLRADEIDCRVCKINKGGVVLLLYKDARVDQNILDETLGVFGWQRKHELLGDRLYCTVSIRNPVSGEWVEKQDVGVESFADKEKGQASDAFKRACFNLGIGRELYSCQDLFFPKDKLQAFKDDGEKQTCWDSFKVTDISYNEDSVASITIEASYRGKVSGSITFAGGQKTVQFPVKNENVPASEKPAPASNTIQSSTKQAAPLDTSAPAQAILDPDNIPDDMIVKVGNCRGMKYADAIKSEKFESFLRWTLTSSGTYPDEERKLQHAMFKQMAQKLFRKEA